MRLTLILRKQNLNWWYKTIWKVQSKRKIQETRTAERLQKPIGIPMIDALELTKPEKTLVKIKRSMPIAEDKPDLLNLKNRICHFFTADTCLLEGEPHSQVLTKTVKIDGLPQPLNDSIANLKVEQIQDSVQRAILHSHLWDAHQEKLPRRVDKERPCHVFKRDYGVPQHRRISLLLSSLTRIADIYAINMPGILERTIMPNMHASAPVEKDGDLLQFRMSIPSALMSGIQLKPICDPLETVEKPLPDIYPIKHTLDLKQESFYDLIDYFAVPRTVRHPFVHTLFIHHLHSKDPWDRSQTVGRALATCYGFAVAQARLHFGVSVKELPRPVVLQCIQTDGQTFDFLVYQLNTLSLDGTDGLKNIAWIDAGHQLMSRCEQIDGVTYFEGLNSDVVKRFLALYLNGAENEVPVTKTMETEVKEIGQVAS